MTPLLHIKNLHVAFPVGKGRVYASQGVNLRMNKGDALCLVGESGSGKTMVGLSILKLLPADADVDGEVWFNGREIVGLKEKEMRKVRGRKIAMIFEQPVSCLNPVVSVGDQIAEAVILRDRCKSRQARERVVRLLEDVGISSAARRSRQYPHELSGGMIQRIMIAICLAFRPELLIADEPTTALDVTVQAQIVELLRKVTAAAHRSLLLITHDLHVAARLCEAVAVMYAGSIVEEGRTADILRAPRHPYTRALLAAASTCACPSDVLSNAVPPPSEKGCRFRPRCPHAMKICGSEMPPMRKGVRCHQWR